MSAACGVSAMYLLAASTATKGNLTHGRPIRACVCAGLLMAIDQWLPREHAHGYAGHTESTLAYLISLVEPCRSPTRRRAICLFVLRYKYVPLRCLTKSSASASTLHVPSTVFLMQAWGSLDQLILRIKQARAPKYFLTGLLYSTMLL